jgi:phosphatidylglycerophosphate synthase
MRKIPKSSENPLDNINIDLIDPLCPLFKKLGFTPNGITTLSLIFGVLSIVALYHHKVVLFGILYYVSYLFDVMDGHYARKYKMTSKFGDIYDHIKDVTVIAGVFTVLFLRYQVPRRVKIIFISIIVVLSILMTAQLGCQEKLYPKEESASLSFSKNLCVGNPSETIKFTRWFGCGTWVVFLIFCIIYLEKNKLV